MAADQGKAINFNAGPAKIPEAVMEKAQREFINYARTGHSILEMSHRSTDFDKVIKGCEQLLREEMSIPGDYDVLFMQGGASGQFAAIPLNLAALSRNKVQSCADYVVTGSWSEKACKEAEKYLNPVKVNSPKKPYVSVSDPASWTRDADAAYLYYCANETVHGIEICEVPETLPGVPLVADVSSNILSRPFDVSKHGIVYGGTQKNLGAAGLTITIVQKDLIGHEHKMTPSVFCYSEMSKNNSVYNTPSCYGIYITKLVLEWIKETGGVHALFDRNQTKSTMIYDIINGSDGFYSCGVDPKYRSHMNVPFRVGGAAGNEVLEKEFLTGAVARGMIGLKGHRSVGGIRASLYNAVTLEETGALAEYMKEFMADHHDKQ
ncbi:hypothetical protein L596_008613 [Steinernema carpocapsae]|uniref:phosphoserine transaminase n=1 Tax=Steinernema carpocapsae TaxID=34508 RepID=A0A4U5PDB2_STECR|nr:hypothetical protein L596_008613 [Steinernema carpocapsae]